MADQLLRRHMVVIPGATKQRQAAEAAGAINLQLSRDESAHLAELLARVNP